MKTEDIYRLVIVALLVLVGIFAVLVLVWGPISKMPSGSDMSPGALSMISTAIAMIGTLVGVVAGQASGAVGKAKADDRASAAMDKARESEMRATSIAMMASKNMSSPEIANFLKEASQQLNEERQQPPAVASPGDARLQGYVMGLSVGVIAASAFFLIIMLLYSLGG